jgi:hypothetical protein
VLAQGPLASGAMAFSKDVDQITRQIWIDTRPGKHTKSYGKSPFFMGKSTISMGIFNSFLYVYERVINWNFRILKWRYVNVPYF